VTPNEVISSAANTIGDGGFVNISKDEYIDFLNDIAQELWFRSKALHVVRDYPLPVGEHYFDLPDRDVISFAAVYIFETANDRSQITDEPAAWDASLAPTWQKEKSYRKNVEEGVGWYMDIGDIVTRAHVTHEYRNGQYRIHSTLPFEDNQYLRAHCIVHNTRYAWQFITGADQLGNNPSDKDLVDNQLEAQIVWEPLRNLFISGVVWRAAERHNRYVQNGHLAQTISRHMSLYYDRYLPDAIHYIHSMRDASSTMQVRPFRYLDE